MIRVLLVEDDSFTLNTLASALKQEGFEVRTASKVSTAVETFHYFDAEAVVLDLDLGAGPTGIDLAHLLKRTKANLGITILTSFQDPRLHRQAAKLPSGAMYVVKQSILQIADLSNAICESIANATSFEPIAIRLGILDMTDVQLETMRMVAEGLTNAEISKRRFVSEKAVEKTIKSITEALKLENDPNQNQRVSIARAYFKLTGGKV